MTFWLLWNRQTSRGGLIATRADPSRSPQILAQVFSRTALERYVPRLQGALRQEVRSWCTARGPVAVYEAAKALTFRMAARILLGLRLDETQCAELARTFQQFVENLFSLPLDVPFSGLRKVLLT